MDIKIQSIDSIGLSVRSKNALHRAGIHTVGELMERSEEELQAIRNLGRKSIEEILEKVKECRKMESRPKLLPSENEEPENFEIWLEDEDHRQMVKDWLKEQNSGIEELELLSVKAYNLLDFSGYEYLYQLAFVPAEELLKIPRMEVSLACEIERLTWHFIREKKEDFFASLKSEQEVSDQEKAVPSIYDLLTDPEYRETVYRYVKENDLEIEQLNLPSRPRQRLRASGYRHLSDIIFKSRSELLTIPSMGAGSVEEVAERIHSYMEEHLSRIQAFLAGDDSALWDDGEIRRRILNLYQTIGFGGLSFQEMLEQLKLPNYVAEKRVKKIIGGLLAEGELEYVDYRCYRVFQKFEQFLNHCNSLGEREQGFVKKRLKGFTLQEIADESGVTRERVRQVVGKSIERVCNEYKAKTGLDYFDEDYYRYLYSSYQLNQRDGSRWLGIPGSVWNYLELRGVKQGEKDLQSALDDRSLDAGLRLKIKNYLNQNKIYIDGAWIEKKRIALEQAAVRRFCQEEVSFDQFVLLYNGFLKQEEIPYDENLYLTEAVYRTRKSRLSDARFLLWKQNERIRYYDIDGRDYTELLETLNLESYENIEVSTEKFLLDYPELMKQYDIRDEYELHNLLRKVVPDGSYHDFHCERMPVIRFGIFDRQKAIMDLLMENTPIAANDLIQLIRQEYGYNAQNIAANYLKPFSVYYHKGVYSVDQKPMSTANQIRLKEALTEDFYYMDEIRRIYSRLVPEGDLEEINPYNLKSMGFSVFSRYVLQNYPSLEAYFREILTKEDVADLTPYKKRFAYVQAFYQTFTELRKSREIIEFEPNQAIRMEKLIRAGVTPEMLQDFCDEVYDFVEEGAYFSAKSLRLSGFSSDLYDLGFSDWFYANLLIFDERFSYGLMFGALILYKGKRTISIKSFEMDRIRARGVMDVYDLSRELKEIYGCRLEEEREVIYKVQDTEIYYDPILDRLYANEDLYYQELDEGEREG